MSFKLFGVELSVSYPFLAVVTAFLALDRTGLGGRMLCAALLHELGHLLMMFVLRQPPRAIAFVSFGIRIVKRESTISYAREILIFLAGPLANFAAAGLLCARSGGEPSQLVLVHLLLGLFNLLPIGVLDGGMAVRNLSQWVAEPWLATLLSGVVSLLFLLPLLAAVLWLTLHGQGNLTLIVTSLYLAATLIPRRAQGK